VSLKLSMVSKQTSIAHNKPLVTPEDIAAVAAALASGWIAQGSRVQAVESEFVRLFGGGRSCAVSSGTAALFLALHALGIGRGDDVALPTYACSALLNAVNMVGANPRPIDVDAASFNINPLVLDEQGGDARCVIAVHTYGVAADISGIKDGRKSIIEDCCQSLGGVDQLRRIGCEGDIAVFSFYATKIITGGQGGCVWSAKDGLIETIEDYRQFDCRQSYHPRFNFQMTDIQAALIGSQMGRLDLIKQRRRSIATIYRDNLAAGLSIQSGLFTTDCMPYRFVIVTPNQEVRDALSLHMAQAGVSCAVPLERHELLHRYLCLDPMDFPIAESLVDTTLSLPIHLCLTDGEVDHIAQTLGAFAV
jgi:perosamine synthetase